MAIWFRALRKYLKDTWHDFCLRQLYNKKEGCWNLFEQKRGKLSVYVGLEKAEKMY